MQVAWSKSIGEFYPTQGQDVDSDIVFLEEDRRPLRGLEHHELQWATDWQLVDASDRMKFRTYAQRERHIQRQSIILQSLLITTKGESVPELLKQLDRSLDTATARHELLSQVLIAPLRFRESTVRNSRPL